MHRTRRLRSSTTRSCRGAWLPLDATSATALTPTIVWRRMGRNKTRPAYAFLMARRPWRLRAAYARSPHAMATSAGLLQRARLAVLFAVVVITGFCAYAGHDRLVRAPGGEKIVHAHRVFAPPTLRVRAARPGVGHEVPDEVSAWLAKVGNLAVTAAIIVFDDVAGALVSAP